MGQWWGEALHREHERKILQALRLVFEPRYRCPGNPECLPHFRVVWLSRWEEFRDGHGRVRVLVDCFTDDICERFEINVTRSGEVILPTPEVLPIAA